MKPKVTITTILGVFFTSLATLMYEMLLTRIFSVTMYYHFAFAAVSMVMLGMTTGAVMVYVLPQFFRDDVLRMRLAQSALVFSLTVILSFITHLCIPFVIVPSFVGFYSIILNFTILASPFVLSGITISLALTRFKEGVSRLYTADLTGAALGCIVLIFSLQTTDGPSAVLLASALAGAGAWAFSQDAQSGRLSRSAMVVTLGLLFLAILNGTLANSQMAPLRLLWVKGEIEPPLLYEKWNSFSRVRVMGDPNVPTTPFGWGLTDVYDNKGKGLVQLEVDIDSSALTVMTKFDGKNLQPLEYLKYDVTNIAHYIRRNADVMVIGVGGGRDILSALVFQQNSVLGIEINGNITNLLTDRYADLTGNLPGNPAVKIVNDEARSYITRTPEKFDILQVSLIDTWAATASGAYVLSENSLYTVEAWQLFLSRLKTGGILSFSRWYMRDQPYEMHRLTSLATETLLQNGIENPRQHIVIIRYMRPPNSEMANVGIGTLLLSNLPFTDADLDELERVSTEMNFEIVLSPRLAIDETFSGIASGKNLDQLIANAPFVLSAPTDDRPFFFLFLRVKDAFNPVNWMSTTQEEETGQKPVIVLVSLSFSVIALTLLSILIPLRMTSDRTQLKGSGFAFVYFASIGLAFMLVEISQMQRLVLFLGHPTYSLSVVLFTLLLASSIGSYTTQRVRSEEIIKRGELRLLGLLGMLIIFGLITPFVARSMAGAETPARIFAAATLLFPPGIFMGMAFPLGIKLASRRAVDITPWLWGINGAASVWASILAVLIAMSFGISTAFWAGVSCYAIALGVWRHIHTDSKLPPP